MHKRAQSIVSLVTAVVFTLTQGIVPSVAWAVEGSASREVRTESRFELALPPDLGTIQTLTSGTGPTLIHIQTAHGNYEAQKKIQALLHYLKDHYGFKTLLVEGSVSQLDPDRLRFFAKKMDLTMKILDDLTKQALVKGDELFLVEDSEAEAYGIEDLDAYVANGEAFKAVLTEQEKTEGFIRDMDMQIERLTSPYLNKDLRGFLKTLERFDAKTLPLMEWLSYLKGEAKKTLGIDLSDPAWQVDWPMLLRVFKLKEFEAKLDPKAFEKERAEFLSAVASSLRGNDVYAEIEKLLSSPLAGHPLPDPETGLLFEKMVSALPTDFNYDAYPNIKVFIGHLILQSEVRGGRLMEEMNRLAEQVSARLARTEVEKKVLSLLKDHRLLKRLFALELTPEDYASLNRHPEARRAEGSGNRDSSLPVAAQNDSLKPSEVIKRFQELNSTGRVRDVQFTHLEDIDSLFDRALEFYRGVKARDGFMLKNIEARLKETGVDKAVVITGGFHSGPFSDYFQKRGFNYALIAPKITSLEGRDNYIHSTLLMGWNFLVRSTFEGSRASDPSISLGTDALISFGATVGQWVVAEGNFVIKDNVSVHPSGSGDILIVEGLFNSNAEVKVPIRTVGTSTTVTKKPLRGVDPTRPIRVTSAPIAVPSFPSLSSTFDLSSLSSPRAEARKGSIGVTETIKVRDLEIPKKLVVTPTNGSPYVLSLDTTGVKQLEDGTIPSELSYRETGRPSDVSRNLLHLLNVTVDPQSATVLQISEKSYGAGVDTDAELLFLLPQKGTQWTKESVLAAARAEVRSVEQLRKILTQDLEGVDSDLKPAMGSILNDDWLQLLRPQVSFNGNEVSILVMNPRGADYAGDILEGLKEPRTVRFIFFKGTSGAQKGMLHFLIVKQVVGSRKTTVALEVQDPEEPEEFLSKVEIQFEEFKQSQKFWNAWRVFAARAEVRTVLTEELAAKLAVDLDEKVKPVLKTFSANADAFTTARVKWNQALTNTVQAAEKLRHLVTDVTAGLDREVSTIPVAGVNSIIADLTAVRTTLETTRNVNATKDDDQNRASVIKVIQEIISSLKNLELIVLQPQAEQLPVVSPQPSAKAESRQLRAESPSRAEARNDQSQRLELAVRAEKVVNQLEEASLQATTKPNESNTKFSAIAGMDFTERVQDLRGLISQLRQPGAALDTQAVEQKVKALENLNTQLKDAFPVANLSGLPMPARQGIPAAAARSEARAATATVVLPNNAANPVTLLFTNKQSFNEGFQKIPGMSEIFPEPPNIIERTVIVTLRPNADLSGWVFLRKVSGPGTLIAKLLAEIREANPSLAGNNPTALAEKIVPLIEQVDIQELVAAEDTVELLLRPVVEGAPASDASADERSEVRERAAAPAEVTGDELRVTRTETQAPETRNSFLPVTRNLVSPRAQEPQDIFPLVNEGLPTPVSVVPGPAFVPLAQLSAALEQFTPFFNSGLTARLVPLRLLNLAIAVGAEGLALVQDRLGIKLAVAGQAEAPDAITSAFGAVEPHQIRVDTEKVARSLFNGRDTVRLEDTNVVIVRGAWARAITVENLRMLYEILKGLGVLTDEMGIDDNRMAIVVGDRSKLLADLKIAVGPNGSLARNRITGFNSAELEEFRTLLARVEQGGLVDLVSQAKLSDYVSYKGDKSEILFLSDETGLAVPSGLNVVLPKGKVKELQLRVFLPAFALRSIRAASLAQQKLGNAEKLSELAAKLRQFYFGIDLAVKGPNIWVESVANYLSWVIFHKAVSISA